MIRAFQSLNRGRRPLRPTLKLGVCAHPFLISEYGSSQDLQFNLMQEMGMTEYRFAIPINASGVVASPSKLTEILTKAPAENINLFPILTTAIDFNLDEATNYSNGFTRGAGFTTSYPTTFPYLEIGNEIENTFTPYTGEGSNISHFDNAKYVRARSFIKGMIDGIKSVNASIKCVIDSGWKHWGYTNQLLLDGCRIDVIAWHWYSDMEDNYQRQIIQKLIELWPNLELWLNEVNSRSQDDAVQASWVSSFLSYVRDYAPRIRRLFMYELFDEPAHADTTERNYGLTTFVNTTTATYKPVGDLFRNVPPVVVYPPTVNTIKFYKEANIPIQPYLQPFLDYSLGYPIKMTRVSAPTWASTEIRYFHGYSKQQRWNTDGTLLKILDQVILHGSTYAFIKDLPRPGSGSSFWSNLDARKLYWFGLNKIYSINVDSGYATPLYTFGSEWDSQLVNVGNSEGNIGIDDRNVMVTMKKGGIEYYIHFDLIDKVIISMRSYLELGSDTPYNWSAISPKGDFIVCNKTTGTGNLGKQLYTKDWVYIANIGRYSHMDFTLDENGNECMTSMGNPAFQNLSTRVLTQNMKTSEMLAAWGDYGGHSSGQSMYGLQGWGCYSPHTPDASGGHDHYITMVKLVYSTVAAQQQFRMFGHHRRGGNVYANEVKAVPNRDGTKILLTSDWGAGNTTNVNDKKEMSYVFELPTAEEIATLPKFYPV